MKSIFIYHHLGLGDHIICNGLVRELANREQARFVYLPTKSKYMNTVPRMYADDSRIVCVPVLGDQDVPHLPQIKFCQNVFKVGFEKCRVDWDVSMYDSVSVPFEKRWTSFKCHRDMGREKMLEGIVNPDNEPFILVHDQTSVGRLPFTHREDIKVIKVEPVSKDGWSDCLLDWCGLMQKAEEIHCVDSSFIHLCTSMGVKGYFHDFGRDQHWGGYFNLPDTWTRVKEKK